MTVITNDSYIPGVVCLAKSLTLCNVKYPLICLVTDKVTENGRARLSEAQVVFREVQGIKGGDAQFGDSFTKLRLWEQTDFAKIVYLDADTVAIRNPDDLFEPTLSVRIFEICSIILNWSYVLACPDSSSPDVFNSGMMVLTPSQKVFQDMLHKKTTLKSYDNADQGFLNAYFGGRWYAMPYKYNSRRGLYDRHPPGWYQVQDKRIIHFTHKKPWTYPDPTTAHGNPELSPFMVLWWAFYHYNESARRTATAEETRVKILLDLDNTIADFDAQLSKFGRMHGMHWVKSKDQRTRYEAEDEYTVEQARQARALALTPTFYSTMDPLPGAIAAVKKLIALGYDVRFCTVPGSSKEYFPQIKQEKKAWVEEHFGREASEGMIFTEDKTLVHADVLIDDKPVQVGARKPDWFQIVYDHPYNRDAADSRPRITDWRDETWHIKLKQAIHRRWPSRHLDYWIRVVADQPDVRS